MALLGALFNLGVYYPLAQPQLPAGHHRDDRRLDLSREFACSPLYGPQPQVLPGWFDTPGIQLGPVYLRQPISPDHRGHHRAGRASNTGSSSTRCSARSCRRPRRTRRWRRLLGIPVSAMIMLTFVYSALLGGIAGILVAPILFVSIQMGATIALEGLRGDASSAASAMSPARSSAGSRSASSRPSAPPISRCPTRTASPSSCSSLFLHLPSARHLRRTRGGESMSAAAQAAKPAAARRTGGRLWRPACLCGNRRAGDARRGLRAFRRLHPAYPGRRPRPTRSPCSASPSCSAFAARSTSRKPPSSALAPMRSGSAPRICMSSFWLALVGGSLRRARHGRLPRHVDLAARRPLSRDGDDQLPADPDPRDDQLDPRHARARRRRQYRRPALFASGHGYPRALRRRPRARRLSRLASSRDEARPLDARRARQ